LLHGASHKSNYANIFSNPYYEIYKRFIAVLVFFFFHNPKRHLEFLKLIVLMKEKGKMILWNVRTFWISMFILTKRVMAMYMPLLAKMAKDNPSIMFTTMNFELLCDINLLISLFCLLSMLGNCLCIDQVCIQERCLCM